MALSKPMEMMAVATSAGCGGFLSTSILYPLDMPKTRIRSGALLLLQATVERIDDQPVHNVDALIIKANTSSP
ncbi:hypothetical protein JG688_00009828 [Phytophthora aleatoria]|uniref:Uncharacterized protein n=1 Tax=Phytophthora aleatoria TaxID=2496075 RepID=A0A8J5M3R5_9STRA|nr:hypothetical protein JG688_00009828 [Phytophthora aleatoria]